MTTSASAPTTIDEIVEGLKDHVWTLLRAGHVNAAMSLLADSIEDYLRIVAEVDSIDAGRHVAPAPTQEEADEPDAAPEVTPDEPAAVPEGPVAVEVVEVTDLPEEGTPVALLVEVEEGTTWQIPLQPSNGKAVLLRERS